MNERGKEEEEEEEEELGVAGGAEPGVGCSTPRGLEASGAGRPLHDDVCHV